MKSQYRFEFVDDIATADAAVRAFGETLAELFAACAAALFTTIVELETIGSATEVKVECSAPDREHLLYEWLSELVYLKDTRREIYGDYAVEIEELESSLKLTATIRGEQFDATRHAARVDVKAVTYHRLEVKETDSGYEAFVVLDL